MITTRTPLPRFCVFCTQKISPPRAEDAELLRRFLSPQAKILSRRKTGVCARHQRQTARAVKHARELGYLSYTGQRR